MRRILLAGLLFAGCEASTDTLTLGPPPTTPNEPEPEPTCTVTGYTTAKTNVVGASWQATGPVHLDGRTLYFGDRTDAGELAVRHVDVDTDAIDTLPGRGNRLLFDAGDGAIAFGTDENTGRPGLYDLIHDNGSWQEVVAQVEAGPRFSGYGGEEVSIVDETSVAYWDRGRVFRWDTNSIEQDYVTLMSPPHVNEGRMVFADRTNEWTTEVWIHNDERDTQLAIRVIEGETISAVRYTDGNLFWLANGRFERVDLVTKEREVLHQGPCSAPDVSGGRAIAACQRGGGMTQYPGPGDFLVYYDGQTATEVFADGSYHYAPRIDDGRIAWINYRSVDVLCAGGPESAGDIRFWDPDAAFEPLTVAAVAAPCLCCDAYWPPAELSFEGLVLAWNYAPPNEQDPRFGGVGYGVIVAEETCDSPEN